MPKIRTTSPSVFARRLVELRKSRQLTQEGLAEKIGISRGTVAYYEANAKNPRLETIRKIAEVFEVAPEYLVAEDSSSPMGKPGPDSKLEVLTKRIQKLSPAKQRMVINMLEGALNSV